MQCAQTNIQLYNQMRRAGYDERDQQSVREAYDLATRLFTAKFRGSGKPLLAHLVGTASILCELRTRETLLSAAVVHAAYIFGEFGDGRPGMTPARREVVRRVVGSETEDLVARYHRLEWQPATVAAVYARLDSLSGDEREVLLVRLANELEDHLDLGVLYCRNASKRRDVIESSLRLCIEMAARIGQPSLAAELERVFDEVRASDVPDILRHPRDYTYLLAPASMMPRPGVTVRRLLDDHPRLAVLLHPSQLLRRKQPTGVTTGGEQQDASTSTPPQAA